MLPPHPLVVKMLDCYETESKAYLVLERAGDLTLEQYMKHNAGDVSIKQVRRIA
jgi:serine/threonine protein kinase